MNDFECLLAKHPKLYECFAEILSLVEDKDNSLQSIDSAEGQVRLILHGGTSKKTI